MATSRLVVTFLDAILQEDHCLDVTEEIESTTVLQG
jgi:hypothetical protein